MIKYAAKAFSELSNMELYHMYRLRQEVFIVEQNCPYLDADHKDLHCYHVMGYDNNEELQCYARIVPPQISYPEYSSIGRVITSSNYRGKGEGLHLMQYSIEKTFELHPDTAIKISAQTYAIPFYEKLGFAATGDEYDEDGIPHIAMLLSR